jgi:hypothetical protein
MFRRFHLQAYDIAYKYGGEVMVVFGSVLSSSAARMTDEDAAQEGFWVSSLSAPSSKANRRLCILKKAAGPHLQRAMEAGDDHMKMVTHLIAQVVHKGVKAEVQASQAEVSMQCVFPVLRGSECAQRCSTVSSNQRLTLCGGCSAPAVSAWKTHQTTSA